MLSVRQLSIVKLFTQRNPSLISNLILSISNLNTLEYDFIMNNIIKISLRETTILNYDTCA